MHAGTIHKYVNPSEYPTVVGGALDDLGRRILCGATAGPTIWHWRQVSCAACLALKHPPQLTGQALQEVRDELRTLTGVVRELRQAVIPPAGAVGSGLSRLDASVSGSASGVEGALGMGDWPLSVRACHVLEAAGFSTRADFTGARLLELRRRWNCGRETFAEIVAVAFLYGLEVPVREVVMALWDSQTQRERLPGRGLVVALDRVGLLGRDPRSLRQMAREGGCTPEWIRQLGQTGLRWLRRNGGDST